MWSSWRRSRPMRRCSWSTPCSSRAMWVMWTQVSYALTVPTQHDVPQRLRAVWAFQCTSLENTRKCKANLQVERNKTVRSQHWMLGKHPSVETTVYSAQQLLLGTLGYNSSSSVLPLCTNCFLWQMKKKPTMLLVRNSSYISLSYQREVMLKRKQYFVLIISNRHDKRGLNVFVWSCCSAVVVFSTWGPWLAFNWPTTVKWHSSTKNTLIIQNSIQIHHFWFTCLIFHTWYCVILSFSPTFFSVFVLRLSWNVWFHGEG